MDKVTRILIVLCLLFVVFATLTVYMLFKDSKLINFGIHTVNTTARDFLHDDPNIKIVAKEKLEKRYRFVFLSLEGNKMNMEKYKSVHPEDIVLLSSLGDGEYSLIVLSNDLPDPKFFKEVK